jgi:pimeloyl-ACP methyl ester carboxylesterase
MQAHHSLALAKWIKAQPWSDGEVHVLGFSWGGRVGLWLPADLHGEAGVFASIALVWPDCRPAERFNAGRLHTPVRIYAAREDPLSIPLNCPNFYAGDRSLLSSLLFPHQRVWVEHAPMPDWTERMMEDWRHWARGQR